MNLTYPFNTYELILLSLSRTRASVPRGSIHTFVIHSPWRGSVLTKFQEHSGVFYGSSRLSCF